MVARLILAATLTVATAAGAAEGPSVEQRADWDSRLAAAKTKQKEGVAAQKEAEARFAEEKKACFQKFRVNDCQNEAKQRYVTAMREHRRTENEGLAAERQVKAEEQADRAACREAESQRQAASLPGRAAATEADREAAARQRSGKLASKEAQARAGKQRRDADAARLRGLLAGIHTADQDDNDGPRAGRAQQIQGGAGLNREQIPIHQQNIESRRRRPGQRCRPIRRFAHDHHVKTSHHQPEG